MRWVRRCRTAWPRRAGQASAGMLLSLPLWAAIAAAGFWALRVFFLWIVLETAARGAWVQVEANGCWTPQATQVTQRAVRIAGVPWGSVTATVTPAGRAGYGTPMTLVLGARLTWYGKALPGGGWTLAATRSGVSLAPASGGGCAAPPG
ncbi:conserved protein of unknown function [Candidatus Hydrogenisulfobacillus filiaventi]|uniref:Uncharacterized protein n=1 Tax=Candidatus Hydrogenisulfobacillus filiaventi TaxID=2707344 RepID=A0A6F8ZIL2_9FIRM|nr:conserved protein of unknown function [Candidatus Hydrogenisulfobacillus filiaventi]